MSLEIVGILTTAVTALLQMVGLVILGFMLKGMREKMDADDAALYLQGKRIEDVLQEMRRELRR